MTSKLLAKMVARKDLATEDIAADIVTILIKVKKAKIIEEATVASVETTAVIIVAIAETGAAPTTHGEINSNKSHRKDKDSNKLAFVVNITSSKMNQDKRLKANPDFLAKFHSKFV